MKITARRADFNKALEAVPEEDRNGSWGALMSEVWSTADRDTVNLRVALAQKITIDVNDDAMCRKLIADLTAMKLTQ